MSLSGSPSPSDHSRRQNSTALATALILVVVRAPGPKPVANLATKAPTKEARTKDQDPKPITTLGVEDLSSTIAPAIGVAIYYDIPLVLNSHESFGITERPDY